MKRTATTVTFVVILAAMSSVGVGAGAGMGYMVGLPWALLAGASVVAAVPGVVIAIARLLVQVPERPWLVYLWVLVALMGSLLVLALNGQLQGGLNYRILGLVAGFVFVAACLSVFPQRRDARRRRTGDV